MDEFRILNSGGLRYQNEFVRHKILDAMGDLYLAGHPLLACYTAHKSGHGLNNKLLRALFADESAYEIVTFDDQKDPKRAVEGMEKMAQEGIHYVVGPNVDDGAAAVRPVPSEKLASVPRNPPPAAAGKPTRIVVGPPAEAAEPAAPAASAN